GQLGEAACLRRRRVGREREAGGEELGELQAREQRDVEIHGAAVLRALRLQRRVHDRRLAGARFADEQRDPGAARETVFERRQRFAMTRGHQQKARVRRQLERPLAQSVEGFVHQRSPFRTPRRQSVAAAMPIVARTENASDAIRIWRCRRRSRTPVTIGIAASTGSVSVRRISSSLRSVMSRYSRKPINAAASARPNAAPNAVMRTRSGTDQKRLRYSATCRRRRTASASFDAIWRLSYSTSAWNCRARHWRISSAVVTGLACGACAFGAADASCCTLNSISVITRFFATT